MKSVLIIGLGRFGHHLAFNMLEKGNDVMVIDQEESRVEDLVPFATSTKIGDCTNPEVLKELGVGNFDIIFVCIGTNFQSSLEITSQVKEMGAKWVVSKATRDIQAKFLLRNGADEVIYPEKDIAEECAVKYSMNHIFDYIEMAEGCGIYEILPIEEWWNKSIRESNIAARYKMSILGIKNQEGKMEIMPSPDHVILPQEHLMVLAKDSQLVDIMKKKKL